MPPPIHKAERRQDSKTILFQGLKLENQHTRKTLGTLSWVYMPSDNAIVFGAGNPCWSYELQDLCPTKTVKGIETHIPLLIHMKRHPTRLEREHGSIFGT